MNKSLLILFLSFIILLSANTFSATEKFGIISKNERWTAENSPYIISDDILISENARVTITPGVQILVGRPISFKSGIEQIDHLDSFTVSIKVKGALKCVGRTENRIIFSSQSGNLKRCQWYGILFDSERDDETEIAFCDIGNACNALTVKQGSPLIRNCIFEHNNVGVYCNGGSSVKLYNCIIAHNLTTGVRIQKANPSIVNNIIAFNKGNGIWSDNFSHVEIEYNCISDNVDGNLQGCNPDLGVIKRVNKNKDSTDFAYNLHFNPIFAGSPADSEAVEKDVTLQTDKSRVKDTTIAKIFHDTLTDSTATKWIARNYKRYSLSKYSPCIDAGNPKKQFKDMDGSRNDMGIFGGQEFVDFSK
ncbi:right-handed parallel beta-helix repeat-containing protein [Fibrobacterota bacterium]